MELHYTKKDFKIEWFSGTGSGGQHRNRHQNCVRITHIETGMKEQSTEFKSRERNKQTAFERLAKRLVEKIRRDLEFKKIENNEVIRNYNEPRNEIHDKETGLKMQYTDAFKNGITELIDERNLSMRIKSVKGKDNGKYI